MKKLILSLLVTALAYFTFAPQTEAHRRVLCEWGYPSNMDAHVFFNVYYGTNSRFLLTNGIPDTNAIDPTFIDYDYKVEIPYPVSVKKRAAISEGILPGFTYFFAVTAEFRFPMFDYMKESLRSDEAFLTVPTNEHFHVDSPVLITPILEYSPDLDFDDFNQTYYTYPDFHLSVPTNNTLGFFRVLLNVVSLVSTNADGVNTNGPPSP